MKKIIFYSIILSFAALMPSCSYNWNDKYNDLPNIQISNMTERGVVPSQLFVDDTLSINPTVTCGTDKNPGDFTYCWYKQGSSSLKKLSDSTSLKVRLDSLGVWTIRLEITNKQTNIMASATVSLNVVSHSQRGWYVLKGTADGNTDMDLFRITDKGGYDGAEYNVMNEDGGELKGSPQGLSFVYDYDWKAPGSSYYTSYIPVLLPVSSQETAAFRMSDEHILERGNDMFFDKTSGNVPFQGLMTNQQQTLLVGGNKVHLMQQGMQAFLPTIPGNYSLSTCMTAAAGSGSYPLAFDQTSHSFAYITPHATILSYFPDSYLPNDCKISSNNMDGNISFMENTDGSLNPDTTYSQRAYAIFHETNRTDRCILLGLDLSQVDPDQWKYGNTKYSPIMFSDTLSYAKYPFLQNATLFAMHKNYPLLYFAEGNKIGSYLITAHTLTDGIITYPSDEEITYMHFTDCEYDNTANTFRYLVVATYNAASDTYKIYRYTVAGSDINQTGDIFTGKGKVKSMIFASPSTYYWNSNTYRCY